MNSGSIHEYKERIVKSKLSRELVALYLKLHEQYWEESVLRDIKKNLGRPPSVGTVNVETI